MAYVEWLRVRNTLRTYAIVLGILFVIVAIVRVSVSAQMGAHWSDVQNQNAVPVDFGYVLFFAAFPALIIGTILGGPLSRERENHLEVVFAKPVSRTAYALEVVLADIAGIIGSILLTTIFMLLSAVIFVLPHFYAGSQTWLLFGIALFGPIAWYAMYLGLTTWMKRGRGAALGIVWPVAILVPGFAALGGGSTALGQAFHAVAAAITAIDPLAYYHFTSNAHGVMASGTIDLGGVFAFSLAQRLGALVLLALMYFIAGFLEWQRVEA